MEERKFCMKSRAELDEIRKQQASKKASVNEISDEKVYDSVSKAHLVAKDGKTIQRAVRMYDKGLKREFAKNNLPNPKTLEKPVTSDEDRTKEYARVNKEYSDKIASRMKSESKINENSSKAEDIKTAIQDALNKIYAGDKEILEYIYVDVTEEDGRIVAEVRTELDYNDTLNLSLKLDKVIRKFDRMAYFDMETPNSIEAIIELNKSESKIDEISDETINKAMVKARIRDDEKNYNWDSSDPNFDYQASRRARNISNMKQRRDAKKIFDKKYNKLDRIPSWYDRERMEKDASYKAFLKMGDDFKKTLNTMAKEGDKEAIAYADRQKNRHGIDVLKSESLTASKALALSKSILDETWATSGSGYVELDIPKEVWTSITTTGENDIAVEEGLKNPEIAKQFAEYDDATIDKAFNDLSVDMTAEEEQALTRHDKEAYILWSLSWDISDGIYVDDEMGESKINEELSYVELEKWAKKYKVSSPKLAAKKVIDFVKNASRSNNARELFGSRVFDNFFENGEKIADAVVQALIDEAEFSDSFKYTLLNFEDYMPSRVLEAIKEPVTESKINEEKIQPSEIYDLAVANLPAEDIDHHQSDLYIRKTPESTALIKQMGDQAMLSTFRDNIDGDIWYDLPFCYTPHWNKSESKINEISDKENKMINNIDKMMANPKNLDPETNEIKSKKLNKELNNLSVYQNRIYSTDSLKEMMSLLSSSTLREKDKETILKAVDNFIDYLNGYIEDNEL